MVSDRDRRDLYAKLRDELGERSADAMMELLPPAGWGDVARRSDIQSLRSELTGEMSVLRAELRSDILGLRSDMKLELASMQTRLIAANVAMACAVGGLVLAATKLA
jgi:hypothetical protein